MSLSRISLFGDHCLLKVAVGPINDWLSLAAAGVLDEEDEASVEDSRSGSLGQQCLAALQVALPWLLRGHLAFFYLYGWYYQWSHRLSGSLTQDPFL